jgi:pimeloyl-ACP methyl ester carboxylesterase
MKPMTLREHQLGRSIEVVERWADALGTRTRYLEAGQGPPLFLIPPAFVGADMFRGVITQLAAHFRVLVAEMPGSGRTRRLDGPWSFDRSADWAAAFLDAVGLDRALVLGHSDGGGAAVVFAARHPDRLDGLLPSGAVGADPKANWPRQFAGLTLNTIQTESDIGGKLFFACMKNLLRHPSNWLYHAALATHTEPLELAPQVRCPTLILWGRKDHALPPACADRFQRAIPNSRIYWSEGSHCWPIQRPRELAGVVAEFAHSLGLLPTLVGTAG